MRFLLCLLLLLGGCGVDPLMMAAGGRGDGRQRGGDPTDAIDALWSLATGWDCSAVRLDRRRAIAGRWSRRRARCRTARAAWA